MNLNFEHQDRVVQFPDSKREIKVFEAFSSTRTILNVLENYWGFVFGRNRLRWQNYDTATRISK